LITGTFFFLRIGLNRSPSLAALTISTIALRFAARGAALGLCLTAIRIFIVFFAFGFNSCGRSPALRLFVVTVLIAALTFVLIIVIVGDGMTSIFIKGGEASGLSGGGQSDEEQ
jgi:hypothetical protein